ncbi:MAG: DNA repair protein-like protein [Podoviridae sp. ctQNx1]|nr:MAG: DNA repair protein-like protein [Podoviridae sp. ctQNx1]UOF78111.1 DNA repair protein [Caudoviricetes sp.]
MTKLFVSDSQGRYIPASPEQIVESARHAVDELFPVGCALSSPSAAKSFLIAKLGGLEHEVFGMIFLTTQNQVLAYEEMFRGTIDQSRVYAREVVKAVLHHNARNVVLTHNHPSGINEPSNADIVLTNCLRDILAGIEVTILDHIIVAKNSTYSFAENGLV